jgi:hypothetical protein
MDTLLAKIFNYQRTSHDYTLNKTSAWKCRAKGRHLQKKFGLHGKNVNLSENNNKRKEICTRQSLILRGSSFLCAFASLRLYNLTLHIKR